ncbi:MAG: right-handed parallel beta-helix repeat-containing protein [Sedimentisphaerales bacterium]|nr:right-handed parallel beta-helix repeat-containing protein [Sedimentisphaerales bacterium]
MFSSRSRWNCQSRYTGFALGPFLFFFIAALVIVPQSSSQANTTQGRSLFISLDGNDAWSGSLPGPNTQKTDGPLKTLTAARDKIRQLKSTETIAGPIHVQLRGGNYYLEQTFELAEQDAGTKASPVVYAAYGEENVRLIAGRQVGSFVPVTAPAILNRLKKDCRTSVLQTDLKAQGINDYGKTVSRGFGRPFAPAGLELFFQHKPMTLARWPNTGWVKIDKVPAGPDGGKFTYTESQPGTWQKSDQVWIHGFWTHDWADSYERIKSIDPATKTIETHPPHGIYGYSENHRYYVLNVLEELDAPGEWYLDGGSGMLYFWPPAPLTADGAIVSIVNTIISMKNCSYTTVQDMTLECSRGTAVEIHGGTGNSVKGCMIRNIGNAGVLLAGGTENGVESCDIFETGDGGIRIYGGDRQSLQPAANYARNNHIYNYSRWCFTYRPAIQIDGVGNQASHNRIHDGPHNAIQLGGNDHMIEYNEIHDVCTESDDVGAFYSGRSWVSRGTTLRYNFFHHIHSAEGQFRHGSRVVYLDDAASGFTVFGNIFYKAGSMCAVNVGGGRDNLIHNNIFVDCARGAWIDTRGLDWAKRFISDGGEWGMYDKLRSVKHDQPPYSVRYPKLASILNDEPAQPRGNELVNNLAVRTPILEMPSNWQHLLVNTGNWSTDADPGFVDIANNNFTLKEDSEVYTKIPQFKVIPFSQIGLYRDAYRKRLP